MLELRKTRFICVSDTHNASPPSSFQLPKGDVLVHAGDLTKEGTLAELEKALGWIEKAEFQVKIVIGGNHDLALDQQSSARDRASDLMDHKFAGSSRFEEAVSNRDPPAERQATTSSKSTFPDHTGLLARFPSITFLNHEYRIVTLQKSPHTTFTVFGSPQSPLVLFPDNTAQRYNAFQYDSLPLSMIHQSERALEGPWFDIPASIDLLVTHTPPYFDETWEDKSSGCIGLGRVISRVRPKIHVCGHVHEARGAQRLFWSTSTSRFKVNEDNCGETHRDEINERDTRIARVQRWKDPGKGTKKLSKVDLKCKESESTWDDCKPRWTDSELQTVIVNASILSTSWPYLKGSEKYNKPIVIDLELPITKVQVEGFKES